MSTNVEKLQEQMAELGIIKLNVFPGTNPNVTQEQVAKEISTALDNITTGNFEEVN